MSTMKALLLTKPDGETSPQLSLSTSQPIPTPAPGSALVKLTATLINPSDILNSSGAFPFTSHPRVLGRDFAGTIVSDGPRKGERVYGTSGNVLSFSADGSHAEYISVPEGALHKIPNGVSDIQAASVGVPFTTAMMALKRAGIKEGANVMVIGSSGAVGGAGVQIAEAMGCKVIRAARGATGAAALDLKTDAKFEGVSGLTGGKGVDVIFDTVGMPAMNKDALNALAVGGTFGFITAPRKGPTEMEFKMELLYRKQQSIVGTNSLLYGLEETSGLLGEINKLIEDEKLKAPKEDGLTKVGLDEAVEAYAEMKGGGKRKFIIVFGA